MLDQLQSTYAKEERRKKISQSTGRQVSPLKLNPHKVHSLCLLLEIVFLCFFLFFPFDLLAADVAVLAAVNIAAL